MAITFSGFNGIDFKSVVNSIIQADSQPMFDLQAQQQTVQNKDNAFVSLSGQISSMESTATSMMDPAAFSNVAAASSDTTIMTTTLGTGAATGSYDVVVGNLAKIQTTSSTNGYAATTNTAADGGSLSFTINGQTTTAINITSATSLSDLATAINNQSSGVVASVVNDGTNNKLVISSRQTGAVNGFTINNSLTNSSGAAIAFAAGQSPTSGNAQNAKDASFTVNGLSITNSSNNVTGAVPGVTLNLLKSGESIVNVTSDYSNVKNLINTFITQYNSIKSFYDQQQKDVLQGDPVMRETLKDLNTTLLTSNSNGGQYQYLAEIGVGFTSTGTLQLDQSKLDQAINSNPADVQKLLQGNGTLNGVFQNLESELTSLDGSSGLIKLTRDSISNTLNSYTDRIATMQSRLNEEQQSLTKIYTAADQAISALNSQTGSLQNLSGKLF